MNKNKKNIIIFIVTLIIIAAISSVIIIKLKNNNKNDKMPTNEEVALDIYKDLIYIENKALITEHQKKLEEKYIEEFNSKEYTLENPYVVTNPYEISPLSALIMFTTETEVEIEVTIKPKNNGETLAFNSEKSNKHYLTIYGLYNDHENQIIIKTSNGETKNLNIKTEKSEIDQVPKMVVNKNSNKINDWFLIDTPLVAATYVYDKNGNIRSYFNNSISKIIGVLDNGHLLASNGVIEEGGSTGIVEIDLAGKVYNNYKLDNLLANESVILENGNIIYKSYSNSNNITDDFIAEIDSNGKTVRTINIYEMMSKIDSDYMKQITEKWGYISGVDYDKENDAILVSFWYSSAVISLDYKTLEINWILSNPNYLSEKFSELLLKPTSSDFVYPKGNYHVTATKDGISLFVTNWDMYDDLKCTSAKDKKSYAATYKIDYKTKTIQEKNILGKDLNNYSYALGDYRINDNLDVILFGRELNNVNYDDVACMVNDYWDISSKIDIYNQNQLLYEASINKGLSSLRLYNLNNKLSNKFEEVKNHNFNYKGNKVEEINYDEIKEKIEKNYISNYDFTLEGNKLNISIDSTNIQLILVNDKKAYRYDLNSNIIEKYFLLNTYNQKFKIYIEQDGEIFDTQAYLYL